MKKETSAPAAEEPARPSRMLYKLTLDHDDVYFGCEPIAEELAASLTERDVVLDHAPDNPPGRYRWLRPEKRLEPLPKERQKDEPGAPTLEQAFYDLAKYGAATPRVAAWCAWFEKTIEAPSRPPKGSES